MPKTIMFNMPGDEAADIVSSNKDELKITIGSVEFMVPTIKTKKGVTSPLPKNKLITNQRPDPRKNVTKSNPSKNLPLHLSKDQILT